MQFEQNPMESKGLNKRLQPVPRRRYRAVHNRLVWPAVTGLHHRLFDLLHQKPA